MKYLFAFLTAFLLVFPAQAAEFSTWLEGVRQEARQKGISEKTISLTLTDDLKPIPQVIKLDRNQPEFKMTLQKYLTMVVPDARVKKARKEMQKHAVLLQEIGQKYGVQPQYLVAFWGLETSFGENTGGFSVVGALATLAHDGRRSKFFRSELFNALKIIDQGHISPAEMKGAWAGAMGQNQFMPSSFLSHAVDHDGDGHKDIWNSLPDMFASSANYLAKAGWDDSQTWGREVKLPKSFDKGLADLENRKPLEYWKKLGVQAKDGSDLPARNIKAAIIIPDKKDGRAFLVYNNFDSIMQWNRSQFYAVAIGLFADRIGSIDQFTRKKATAQGS